MPSQKQSKPASFFKKLFKWLAMLLLTGVISIGLACYLFLAELSKELPDIDQLQNVQYQTPLRIYSQDGLLIAQFGEKRRIPVTITQVPERQIQAFLAAEDDRFYSHPGIDYKGLLRASAYLIATGKKRQGGSTITMQVARNFLLSNEKTYLRKLKEILLALQIERRYNKNDILELYLNKIYMGQRAYGVAAAAQAYYGKDMQSLTLAQQAMVAGLPKAPSLYNPIVNPERALERRDYVLRRMLELQFITSSEYDSALKQVDDAKPQSIEIQLDAPYVAEMVRQEMMNKYGDEAYSQGLKVYTTVPSKLQIAADHALQKALHIYDERHGYRGLPHKKFKTGQTELISGAIGDCYQAVVTSISPQGFNASLANHQNITILWRNITWGQLSPSIGSKRAPIQINDIVWVKQIDDQSWALSQIPAVEGAFAALNPNNGAILAIAGGFDFANSKYNRATQSKRQPGSGFKPFIYTAALEKGFTPASIINDAPVVIEDPSQENDWRPENYTHKYRGPIPLRVALRESINLVSIRLLQDIGIEYALETAMRFGFERDQLPGTFSLALGSGHATPLKMASAYATFANGGYLIKPYLIDHIEDHTGAIFHQTKPLTACGDCSGQNPDAVIPASRIITPPIHFLMNSLLRDVVQRGTATQAKELGREDLAGKTGTTNEQRDAWFNGFNPDIVASAWVGFDNSTPLGKGETGGKAALPMWIEFMRTALQDKPVKPLEPPVGIVEAYVNPRDGLLLKPNSKGGILEYFSEESVPQTFSAPKPKETEFDDLEDLEALGSEPANQDSEAESLF